MNDGVIPVEISGSNIGLRPSLMLDRLSEFAVSPKSMPVAYKTAPVEKESMDISTTARKNMAEMLTIFIPTDTIQAITKRRINAMICVSKLPKLILNPFQ